MKKLSLLFGGIFLIAGCLGGYSPESKFYALQTEEQVEPVSTKKMSVGIDTVSLPEVIDRPQMVVSKENSPEVIISETNRWSESLETMIQGVLSADIADYMPQAEVKIRELNDKLDVIISVEVLQFKMIENKQATLEAWWSIVDRFGKASYRQKFVGAEEIDRSFDSFVEAESKLLSALARDIAEKISK